MRAGVGVRLAAAGAAVALSACGAGEPDAAAPPDATPVASEAPVEPVPPSTDILVARMTEADDGSITLSELRNATHRPGYDNQPGFLPDGSAFRYTTIDDLGEADIWLHPMDGGANRPVTSTAPESEYSATPLPGGLGFSAIRVEADSTQRLWRFDDDGGGARVLFPDIAPVGYHAWVGDETAVLFVLGDPPTLQVASTVSGSARTVARDIGRSIQPIPGTAAVSWVQRLEGGATEIRRLDPATGESTLIVEGLAGGDFHAWTPAGLLLQADGSVLYAFRPGVDEAWRPVADLSDLGVTLSRIAVHPDGTWIALVAESRGG